MRDLAAGGLVNADAGVLERGADGALEFDARFLVGGHGRHQCGLGRGQTALGLQDGGRGRGAKLIFLLLGIERLLGVIHRSLGRGHAGAVLFDPELGVADLDADLVFDLLQAHQGLLIFQLRADLRGLSGAVADGNVELDADAFIGSGGVDELVQRSAIAHRSRDRDESPGSPRARAAKTGWRLVDAEVRGVL